MEVMGASKIVMLRLGEDFLKWKQQLKVRCLAKQAWGTVTGTYERPERGAELETWLDRDAKAMAYILENILPALAQLVDNCETARQHFLMLQNHFNGGDLGNKTHLRKKLYKSDYAEAKGKSCSSYG